MVNHGIGADRKKMLIGNLGQFTKTSAFTASKYYATQVHKEILSLKI
jgi:hypothetical protein